MSASASHLIGFDSIADQIHTLSEAYATFEETIQSNTSSSGILNQWTNLQKEQKNILQAYATLSKSQDNRIEYQSLALSLQTQIKKQLGDIQTLDNQIKRRDKDLTQLNQTLQQEATEISQAIKKSNQTADAISTDEKDTEQNKKEKEAKLEAYLSIARNPLAYHNDKPLYRMVDAYEKIFLEDLLPEEEKTKIPLNLIREGKFYEATLHILRLANTEETPLTKRARQLLINAANNGFTRIIYFLSDDQFGEFLSPRERWKYTKILLKHKYVLNISFSEQHAFYYKKMTHSSLRGLTPIKLSASEKEIIIEGAEFYRYQAFQSWGVNFKMGMVSFCYAFPHLDSINKNIFLLNAIAVLSVAGSRLFGSNSYFYGMFDGMNITGWHEYIGLIVEGSETKLSEIKLSEFKLSETKLNATISQSEQESLRCLVSYIRPFNQLARENPAFIAYFLLDANFLPHEVENIYNFLHAKNIKSVERYHRQYQKIVLTLILSSTLIPVPIANLIIQFIDPIKSIHDIATTPQSISDRRMIPSTSQLDDDKTLSNSNKTNNPSIFQTLYAALFSSNTSSGGGSSSLKRIPPRGYRL